MNFDFEPYHITKTKGAKLLTQEKTEVVENPKLAIPLVGIRYAANIAGANASVNCLQEYENKNSVPVEAIYVFPMPDEASVTACRIIIGDKKIEAELKEQQQAKAEYEQAVQSGHHAALVEQKRDNVFKMSVGGIEPGENIQVELTYHQRVEWQDGGGRFVIPTVVAPRFIPGVPTGSKTGGGWAEDTDEVPDASEITPVVAKDGVPYKVDISVVISGYRFEITSPSYELAVEEWDSSQRVNLTDLTPDRDFILCYTTGKSKVESTIHMGSHGDEQFAIASVFPPGIAPRKKKRVVLCADCSGSMLGAKMHGLKVIAKDVVERLDKEGVDNEIAIVGFDTRILIQSPMAGISPTIYNVIDTLGANGGTRAGMALDYCFGLLTGDPEVEEYILLVADGQTNDRWHKIKPNVRVIAVGIDAATNQDYMREIAKETGGTTYWVYPGEDYSKVSGKIVGLLSGPVLRNVKVTDKSGNEIPDTVGVADVYQKMPAVVSIRAKSLPEEIVIQGVNPKGEAVKLGLRSKDAHECTFAPQIWARTKLSDEKLSEQEQIDISLKYGVLCSKTAFVAVHEKEMPGQAPERVEVPVMLPHTWDYDAVFGSGATRGMMSFAAGSGGTFGLMFDDSVHEVCGAPTYGSIRSRSTTRGGTKRPNVPATPAVTPDTPEALVKELEEKLVALKSGQDQLQTSSDIFNLIAKIRAVKYQQWPDALRAKCYYLLVLLTTFSFPGHKATAQWVKDMIPTSTDTETKAWLDKANKVLGKAV